MPKYWNCIVPMVLVGSIGIGPVHAESKDRGRAAAPPALLSAGAALPGEARILQGMRARSTSRASVPGGTGNSASITQVGSSNRASIAQSGNSNISIVEQVGSSNLAVATVSGSGNRTIQTQNGSRNDSRIRIDNGRDNTVRADQTGDDNRFRIVLRETENLNLSYTQSGGQSLDVERPIVVESSGPSPMEISIQQAGN